MPMTAMRSSFYTWHLSNLFHVGSQTVHPFCDPAPFGGDHFFKQALGALWRDTSPVAFSDFCPYKLTSACEAKSFGSSLMGLQLIFSGSFLPWHNLTPVVQNPRILIWSAERICFLILGQFQRNELFLLACLGWRQDHQHRSPFETGSLFNHCNIG